MTLKMKTRAALILLLGTIVPAITMGTAHAARYAARFHSW